ncbi:Hypothetical protein NTJ_05324 [Nesidiocoris tenuis]|uniref:Uncharacterized protein n=1 Tax=Nesidiocoris tenuis TaxID=355587 RepID=A0ABN7AJS7_9HEMI|nr:Hypothetical protein NTJ_05324 [Nesidiocoris tenuis]
MIGNTAGASRLQVKRSNEGSTVKKKGFLDFESWGVLPRVWGSQQDQSYSGRVTRNYVLSYCATLIHRVTWSVGPDCVPCFLVIGENLN